MRYDPGLFSKMCIGVMKARNWTQRDLARYLGIDQSTVNLWIKQNELPARKHMSKFAELTGLAEDDLALIREAIRLESQGVNLGQLNAKGVILSDDEQQVIHWIRTSNYASVLEYLVDKMKQATQ